MGIKIITDSAADLPKELAERYQIEVLPLLVFLGDEEFRDSETIQAKEMFDGMRQGSVYKTSQVSMQTFRECFTGHAKQGDRCIYVAFSSGLSGTYQSSVLVKNEVLEEYPDFELESIDTKCASIGFGLVVLKAAQMAQDGCGFAEIVDTVRFYSENMEHVFTVDNLDYLYRGGRVSRAAAIIGGLLNIKPVLHVDEEGKLIPLEKVRGRKKSIERLVELMEERGVELSGQTIGISHGDDPEAAAKLAEMVRQRFGCEAFVVGLVGCAVGAHSGPGTLALFFLSARPQ